VADTPPIPEARAVTDHEYLTPDQLAELLQVSRKTIYDWRRKGTGPPAALIGRHLRYRRSDVTRWVNSMQT
jgi:excisionase family DNA binding protein